MPMHLSPLYVKLSGLKLRSSIRETWLDLSLPRSQPQIVKWKPKTHHTSTMRPGDQALDPIAFPFLKPSS